MVMIGRPLRASVTSLSSQAAHERSLQPADGERGRQVLVRLANDERAQLVFGPAGLKDEQPGDDEDERSENGVDEPAEKSKSESKRAQHP